ncbi:MAG: hypothetical protein BMS9Abin25_0338 [Gammaproteobacteria bacterium]|nr:MAG: hypothetical protein BMS9Abin25_0338 [Gammaproteobacteria bacterium]
MNLPLAVDTGYRRASPPDFGLRLVYAQYPRTESSSFQEQAIIAPCNNGKHCEPIMGPGGYRIVDFLKAGGGMTVLFLVVMMVMMSLVFWGLGPELKL